MTSIFSLAYCIKLVRYPISLVIQQHLAKKLLFVGFAGLVVYLEERTSERVLADTLHLKRLQQYKHSNYPLQPREQLALPF